MKELGMLAGIALWAFISYRFFAGAIALVLRPFGIAARGRTDTRLCAGLMTAFLIVLIYFRR